MRHWIKYIIVMVLAVVIGISSANRQVAAATMNEDTKEETVLVRDKLVVTISIGFSEEARYGRYVSAQVSVYNNGDAMKGSVGFTLLNENQDNITYAKEAEFSARNKTEVTVMLPMNKATQSAYFTIVDSDLKTVVEEEIDFDIKNYGEYCVIGVLSQKELGLSYLEYFGNKIINLDGSDLPSDYLAYNMLDVLVVDHFDLDTLGPERLNAILEFVSHGGNLVIGAGDSFQSNVEVLQQYKVLWLQEPVGYTRDEVINMPITLSSELQFTSLLTKIKNYEANRTMLLREVEEDKALNLTNAATTKDYNIYFGKSMLGNRSVTDLSMEYITKEVTKFRLQNPRKLIENGGIPLFETVSFGDGMVMLYHFCLDNTKITLDKLELYGGVTDELFSSFYADVVKLMLDNISDTTKLRLKSEVYADSSDYRIQEISKYQEMTRVPKVGGFLIVLVLYLLVIGPLTYYILRKMKKQRIVWMVIPCVSLAFFFLIVLLGKKTRVDNPYAGFLNIEIYNKKLDEIQGKAFGYLGMNKNGPITIKLEASNPILIGESGFETYYGKLYTKEQELKKKFYDYKEANTSVLYKEDSTYVTFYNQPAFSKELIVTNYKREYEDLVKGSLTMTKNSLNGKVTNVTNRILNNAFIYFNGYYVYIGTMNPGQTIQVADCLTQYFAGIDSLFYSDNLISKTLGTNTSTFSPNQYRLINAYSYLFKYDLLGQENPIFFATSNQISQASPLYEISKEDESYGENVVMSELDFTNKTVEGVLVPNLDKYLINTSSYAWDPETRYAYMNTMDFEYQLPDKEVITELYLSKMFNKFESDPLSLNDCNRVYFYNFAKQTYELIFDLESEYGARSIKGDELLRFISEDQRLMIRFENRDSNQSIFEVPVISGVKEVWDAQN